MANLLSDIWSFHLAIVGIAVSVFTLFFSSFISKSEEKKVLNRLKDESIYIQNRNIYISNELEVIKEIVKRVAKVIGGSVFLFILSSISKHIDCCEKYLFWPNIVLTIFLCFYIIHCLIYIYKYIKNKEN